MSSIFSLRSSIWVRWFYLSGLFLFTAFYHRPIMAYDHQTHFENKGHQYLHALQLRTQLRSIVQNHPEVLHIQGIASLLQQLDALAQEFQYYSQLRGLSPQALAQTVKQSVTSFKTSNSTPLEEEIDPDSFINACLQWRKTMRDFFIEKSKALAEVRISLKDFSNDLSENQSTVPIVKAIYQEWSAVLTTLQQQSDTAKGSDLFDALLHHPGSTWAMTKDPVALKKHYKARGNRSFYKKINADTRGFEIGLLPTIDVFTNAIAVSTMEDDPNLPNNQKQKKEHQKAALKAMKKRWDTWLNETLLPALAEIDTATESKIIDTKMLVRGQSMYIQTPSYARSFCDATSTAITQKVQAAGGTLSYNQVVNIAIQELRNQYNHFVTDEFLRQAIESGQQDLPIGFKRWLVSSIDRNDALLTQFIQTCQQWATSVKGITEEAEAANNNHTFKVARNKWVAQLQTLFKGSTMPLLNVVTNALPQQEVLDLPTIRTAWTEALTQLQTEPFLEALWVEYFTMIPHDNMEQAITTFHTHLPTLNTLSQRLLNARYIVQQQAPPKLVQHAQTDTVETRLAINWNEVQILMTSGLQGISEETGLESAVEELAGWLPGNWNLNTTAGLGGLRLRTTQPTELDLKLPLQLQRENGDVVATPQALDNSMIKFVGNNDNYYTIDVQHIKINTPPVRAGAQVRQEVLVTLAIIDPQLSISFSTSTGIASVEAAVGKNPSKTSVDLVFELEQNHDATANQISIHFTGVRLVEANNLMQAIRLSRQPVRQLAVFQ